MFTGLVAAVGRVIELEVRGDGLRLAIAASGLADPKESFVQGESIAVSGVCLTVVDVIDRGFTADVSGETLRVTKIGRWHVGDGVNLERALRVGDRLGGHMVSGHVDAVGRFRESTPDALSTIYRFDAPNALLPFIAIKGSIAVDGVSLTVNTIDESGFSVNLIPHTLSHTTLGGLLPGDLVNLEVDQIARYAERLLAFRPHRT